MDRNHAAQKKTLSLALKMIAKNLAAIKIKNVQTALALKTIKLVLVRAAKRNLNRT